MSFLEMLTLVASSAAIFGLIFGVFSFYNGRRTRQEISRQIRETNEGTQDLIRETNEFTQRLIRETNESTQRLIREIWDRSEMLLVRLAEGQEAAREEHKAILERLAAG